MGKAQLLVFEEKHGNRYFHITKKEDLERVALKVLAERWAEGWFNDPRDDVPQRPDTMNLSSEDLSKMPESLRKEAVRKNNNFQHSLESWERSMKEFKVMQEVLEKKDGKKAWAIIHDRRDAEYEGYTLKSYENA